MTTDDPGFVFTDIVAGCGCSFPFAYCIMFDFSSRAIIWMCLDHGRSESEVSTAKLADSTEANESFWRYIIAEEEHLQIIATYGARPTH